MKTPRALVACEMSGRVRDALTALGWDAISCDLLPSLTPGKHYQGDVRDLLWSEAWDLVIGFPPCTYLTISAEWAYGDGPYHQKVKPETLVGAARREARVEAVEFVRQIMRANSSRIAIENPIGALSSLIRKPDQIIHPYQFGANASKATCLWLEGLPALKPTEYVPPRMVDGKPRWGNQTDSGQNKLPPREGRAIERGITYQGIAEAMASQWTQHILGRERV